MFQLKSDSTSASVAASPKSRTLVRRVPRTERRQRPSTVAAYARDLDKFINTYGGTIPCSADSLIAVITLLLKRVSPVTIARRCMAIQDAHVRGNHPSPTHDPRVREALRWMVAGQPPHNLVATPKGSKSAALPPARSRKGKRQAKPITRALLMRMLDAMGSGARTKDRRDQAILMLGFAGLKRGTICALNIEDCTWTADAMILRLRVVDDATDAAEGAGAEAPVAEISRTVAIPLTRGPLCAATACRRWLEHNDLVGKTGPMFCRFTRSSEPQHDARLSSAFVSVIVKEHLKAAGVADFADYSGESLRRGHQMESVKGGVR